MPKTVVGVLRGGPSSEYEVSLKTGASVLKHLPEKYTPHDIFISRDGIWHSHGLPRDPDRILRKVDVVFNALHGAYGEDGKVQKLLEQFGVPYTGSQSIASALGMNKALSKKAFETHNLKTPRSVLVRKDNAGDKDLVEIFQTFPHPYVVKPVSAGSSVGVSVVRSFSEFLEAVKESLMHSSSVLVEEYIKGREATCAVVENFRGETLHALMPVEIVHPNSEFFDYQAKYSGESQEICPANFDQKQKEEIQRMTAIAHKALQLRHYSRSDFIVSPRGEVYILETNTLPGLTEESLLPKALAAGGTKFPDFLDHLVGLAMKKK